MPGEFKVASGYIEIVSKVNERAVKAGADAISATAADGGRKGGQLAGDEIGKGVEAGAKAGGKKAGTELLAGVKPGAKRAGDEVATEAERGGKEGGKRAGEELGKGAEQGAGKLGGKLTELLGKRGEVAGSAFGDMFGGKLAGLAAAGGIAAAGAAVGGIFMAGYQKAIEQANIGKMLVAKTGLDPAFAKDYGKAAGDLYAKGFGDSVAQVGETITQIFQSGLNELDPSRTFETMAGDALNVAKIMGEDVKPVIRDVSTLIRTGLAKNSQEAFDLLIKGEQSGANSMNDLLDTLQEYPVQFEKLGIKGPQAIGLISQAMKAGARSSDLAADALKEFSIRAVDGSKLTGDSFTELGLDAEKMASDIAAGGSRANGALGLTLDKLREIPDPVKRSQVAVGLFGTQAEDLGKALYAMDTNKAVSGLGDVAGAAKKAGDEISGTSNKTELFKRKMEQGFTNYISEKVIPAVDSWTEALKGVGDWLDRVGGKGTASNLGKLVFSGPPPVPGSSDKRFPGAEKWSTDVGREVGSSLKNAGKETGATLKGAWKGVEDFFTKDIPGWLNKAGDEVGKLPGKIGDTLSALPEQLGGIASHALDVMADQAGAGLGHTLRFFADLPQNIYDAVTGLPDMLGRFWDDTWNFTTPKVSVGVDGVTKFFTDLPDNIWNAIKDIGSTLSGVFDGAWNWARSVVRWHIDTLKWEIGTLPGALWDMGGDIIDGLVNGISNMSGKLWDLAKRLAGEFIGGFRRAFDSHSPSRVMDRIGEHEIGAGLLEGLDKVAPKLPVRAGMLADAFTGGFNATAKAAQIASAAAGTSDTAAATGSFGPYSVELDGAILARFVIDTVTGSPKQIAATVDEGRRQRSFVDTARARR